MADFLMERSLSQHRPVTPPVARKCFYRPNDITLVEPGQQV